MMEADEAAGEDAYPRFTFSELGDADVDAAYEWLRRFGLDVAEHWLGELLVTLRRKAQLVLDGPLRRRRSMEAPEGHDFYLLLYRTGGRRGSPWQVVYEIVDEDGDGVVDSLLVIRVRHAASE